MDTGNTAVLMCTTSSAGKEKKLRTWSGEVVGVSRFCRLQRVLGVSPGCTLCLNGLMTSMNDRQSRPKHTDNVEVAQENSWENAQITFNQQGALKTCFTFSLSRSSILCCSADLVTSMVSNHWTDRQEDIDRQNERHQHSRGNRKIKIYSNPRLFLHKQ